MERMKIQEMEVRAFGSKRALVVEILKQLGHDIPDDDTLQSSIIKAAREMKMASGFDPGPSVKLALIPLPGTPYSD